MPLHHPITVELDCAEPRIALDRLLVSAGGRPEWQAWGAEISSGVWRDPVRRRVMLSPLPVTPAWRTTTTGNYARLRKTDYTLTTASAWVENPRGLAGNYYLEANGTNERVVTAASYSADQAWFVSLYVPGVQSLGEQTIFECGWGTYGDAATVMVRVRANGRVAVYKGGVLLGTDDLDFASGRTDAFSKSLNLSTVNLLLLPTRPLTPAAANRDFGELVVVTDAMSGYCQRFEGLAASDPICPAGVFWWQVPVGRPVVQLAPCFFETSGTLYGPVQTLRYAPDSPRTFTATVFGAWTGKGSGSAGSSASLVKASDLTSYSPDGTTVQVRGKIDLTGDGTASLAMDAADWECVATTTATNSAPLDITAALTEISLRMDDKGVCRATLAGRGAALEALSIPGLRTMGDRPFRIFITKAIGGDKFDIIRGTLSMPLIEPGSGKADGQGDLITWEGCDRSCEEEYYQFCEANADDGANFKTTLEKYLGLLGHGASSRSISATSLTLPQSADTAGGEWALLPQRGQTLRQWLDGLFDGFAANWWRGWVPSINTTPAGGYIWRAHNPGDLSTSPALEIYEKEADALADGMLAEQVQHRTIRKDFLRRIIPAEANQIIAIGQNPTTRRLILSQYNDAASQAPATAPGSRPANWRSRLHRVQLIDPAINSQALADSMVSALTTRLTVERHVIEFKCDFLIRATDSRIIWTGDVVRLWLSGGNTYEDYRIVAMPEVHFLKEFTVSQVLTDGRVPVREATYHAERIGTGP